MNKDKLLVDDEVPYTYQTKTKQGYTNSVVLYGRDPAWDWGGLGDVYAYRQALADILGDLDVHIALCVNAIVISSNKPQPDISAAIHSFYKN